MRSFDPGGASSAISALRLPLATLVVMIHSVLLPLHYVDLVQIPPPEGVSWIASVSWGAEVGLAHLFAHIAVPAFLFISGYLYFLRRSSSGFTAADYWRKSRSRFFTLLVPYLFWNLFYVGFVVLQGVSPFDGTAASAAHLFWDYSKFGLEYVNVLGQHVPLSGPVSLALWYLRDLMVCCLLAPVVWWLVSHSRGWAVLLLGVLYVCGGFDLPSGLSVSSLFWFSFGALFSILRIDFVARFRGFVWPALALSVALLILLTPFDGKRAGTWWATVGYGLFILSTVSLAFVAAARVASSGRLGRWLSSLGAASYFVYLTHVYVLRVVGKAGFASLFDASPQPLHLLLWLVEVVVVVAICVGGYFFLSRFAPWALLPLVGWRRSTGL